MRYANATYQTGFLISMLVVMSGIIPLSVQPPGVTVHVFLSTECPISQQYVRQLTHLQQQYGPLGVRFIAWFPLRTDSPRTIRQFQTEYALSLAGKPDSGARLARQLRVRVTPEVAVLQADGRVRYQGAIDNWYVTLGRHRTGATQHYLRDALNALLAGKEVPVPETDAVGCLVE